ncbi:hypothetical protein HanIR_Chr13g0668011 [Helianthus annuus]|nr:hypothetical protein HanIR_Chr13g0668011 [Helianthus annuus]
MVNSPGSSSLPSPPVPASSGLVLHFHTTFRKPILFHFSRQWWLTQQSLKRQKMSQLLLHPCNLLSTHPGSFMQGMNTQVRPPPSSVAVPREVASDANFSYNGNHQLPQKDQSHAYSPLGATSSNPNTASPPFRMPPGPPFQPPPGAPRTPVTPQQPFYGSYASNSPMARSLHQSETCLDRNFYHIHLRFLCQLNARHCRWSNHPMLSLLVHQLEFRAAWLKQ